MTGLTFSPRVVGLHRPDFHCLECILASPQFAGKTGEELALAIYDYFTSTVDGTYHFWPPGETEGNPRIRRSVFDPVKLLNAYGWAICGQCAHILYGLYTTGGLKARYMGLPGHSLCEVHYDGRWHILDVDMWTWFRTPEGHIASAAELARQPEALILHNTNRSNPCNLPDRSLEDYAKMYARTKVVDDHVEQIGPPWHIRAHHMDFHLRPGETLIRSQRHDGRFHLPRGWVANQSKYRREWKGHPRERYEPFRTFGNGRWIYEPNLSAAGDGQDTGLWEPTDLTQDAAGMVGPGSATWRIHSPYPFCGIPDCDGERITHRDGVWLALAGRGPLRAELTDPEGRWSAVLEVPAGPFARTVDVTDLLSSRYECLVRISAGKKARLARLRFEGFILTAPMSIPRLVTGENPMELRWGDKYGLCTVPWSAWIDFREGADLPAQWVSAWNARVEPYCQGFLRIAPAEAGPVGVTFRFDAPGDRRFAWAYAHASLNEGPPEEPPGQARLDWSADGQHWQELSRGEISNTLCQFDTSIDGEVRFAEPIRSMYLRVKSQTPISGVEFHGHLACDPPPGETLRIVHRWVEGDGQHKTFEAPAGAARYAITCGQDPRDHSIEMSVPAR